MNFKLLAAFTFFTIGAFSQRGVRYNNLGDALKNRDSCFYLELRGLDLATPLPDTLFSLYNLESLVIVDCRLTTLPEGIGKLTHLKELLLNFNRLTTLPENIGNLSDLEELFLNNNQLTSLPASFCKLKKLSSLTLDNNLLPSVPACLQEFGRLDFFDADDSISVNTKSVGPMDFHFSDTVWNANKTKAVFLAKSNGLVRNKYGSFIHVFEIRMFDPELAATTTLVRSDENNMTPEEMLLNFEDFAFSSDSKYVYFIVESAWEKTNAVHRVNIFTHKQQFVVDADWYEVLTRGEHKDELLVSRLYYNEGGPGNSYWLISGNGKNKKEITDKEGQKYQKED